MREYEDYGNQRFIAKPHNMYIHAMSNINVRGVFENNRSTNNIDYSSTNNINTFSNNHSRIRAQDWCLFHGQASIFTFDSMMHRYTVFRKLQNV